MYLTNKDIKPNHVYLDVSGRLFSTDEDWIKSPNFEGDYIRLYSAENEGEWNEAYFIFKIIKDDKTIYPVKYLIENLGEL
jgi:hypothetical protein